MSLHPNETVFNKIDDFISNNADKIIKDTIDLINIPSVSTDKSKINEAMSLILQKGKNTV